VLFSPPIVGAQPPGSVVLAQEDEDLAVALALKPASRGLFAVVTVLGQDGTGVGHLTTVVGIHTSEGSATARAVAGYAGTYQTTLATAGTPIDATVTINGAGSFRRSLRFDLADTWPPRPATALMLKVDSAYGHLKTLVTHEHLASDPVHSINSVYRAIAPNTLEISSSNGTDEIVIGTRRWDKQPGRDFAETTQRPPLKAITPYWTGILEDPTLLGSVRFDGHEAWVVSFAAPQIPAFFQIDVDKATDRTLAVKMTASAHFMYDRYGPFDRPLSIEPPRSTTNPNERG